MCCLTRFNDTMCNSAPKIIILILPFLTLLYHCLYVFFNVKLSESRHVYHAYQSLACETAISTDFSELFSPKRIYVKYKNAILSLIDSLFRI